jgi:glutathione S-transferase
MTIEVFGADVSAPCRLVYMTCEMLGIEYKKMPIDLMKGETRTPEFLKVRNKIFV